MATESEAPIIVLGGDGYLGWPLSLMLARRHATRRIVLVDNRLRRRLVAREGGASLLPILNPEQRLQACRSIYRLTNMEYIELDVTTEALDALIRELKPAAVYHLAQQCSAPYSMRGSQEALFTLRNNEEGNMRLLWAVKQHVPDCHIIKLGSFGEYAKSGLDIAEGYFMPGYKGKVADQPVPYPRQSDDFYHASKINDTNYISIACRIWGLRITDVMQSTIFGSWTPDIEDHRPLYTRLDYDECFGTVLNRFLAQAVCGLPLTVYGTGHQRTGLMSLGDSVRSLADIWEAPPSSGTHRVINHLTEESFSINELADTVRELVSREGFSVDIQRGIHDPRGETVAVKLDYGIDRDYITDNIQPESLSDVVSRTLHMLLPFRDSINTRLFVPRTSWNPVRPERDSASGVVVPIGSSQSAVKEASPVVDEAGWEAYRHDHFPYRHINLNPGTLGSPSSDVLDAIRDFHANETLAQPLAQYGNGKQALLESLDLTARLWPSPQHAAHVTASASHCSNLLALSLARTAAKLRRPLRLLTTVHEHKGGLGAFEKLPEFDISYLGIREMRNPVAFERLVAQVKPDIAFFSHVTYDTGQLLPVSDWAQILKRVRPDVCVLIDISQSLGLLPPPFESGDVLFGSCHKWLFGPRGTGLLWTTAAFRQRVGAIYWSGESLLSEAEDWGFSVAGGADFSTFAGLCAALRLHQQVGTDVSRERSAQLAAVFKPQLRQLLDSHGIAHRFLASRDGRIGEVGVLTVSFLHNDPYPLYDAMNRHALHTKCIKDRTLDGRRRYLIRFGFPYFESEQRLREALFIMETCLGAIPACNAVGERSRSPVVSLPKRLTRVFQRAVSSPNSEPGI